MILYEYKCSDCEYKFTAFNRIKDRDLPTAHPCPRCSEYSIDRSMGCGGFSVPEGALGNAKTGYSETHGDAENFKARAEGKSIPYGPECRISDKKMAR